LRIGTEFYFPLDRPVPYGLTIAPIHMIAGLWAVIFVQSLFTTWLVGRVLTALFGPGSPWRLLLTMALLSALSSLPWVAGQVMPDLFSGMMALVIFLLVFGHRDLARWEKWAFPVLLAGMASFHYSHLLIGGSVTVVAIIFAWAIGDRAGAKIGGAKALGAIVVAGLALSTLNLAFAGSFRPSLLSNTFIFVKLLDERLAQGPMNAACAKRRMIVCEALAKVNNPADPLPGQAYLWSGIRVRSDKEGAQLRAEETDLMKATIAAQPIEVIRHAFIEAGRQIVNARAGDGLWVFDDSMQVAQQIRHHFPASVPAWEASLQQHDKMEPLRRIPDRPIALIVALLSPLIVFLSLRRGDRLLAGFAVIAVTMVLMNGAVCGALSLILDRYQSRALWVLPLLGILALYRWVPWIAGPAMASDVQLRETNLR
ncbi:MAG: hypothetical protein JWR77_2321, partial [Rhizorhabdus sp.]|nr:hypothetical protein [Rhizorhabdus sp.]